MPVSRVRAWGLDVLVARHRVSNHYVQCALFGGGAEHVERSLKRGELPAELVVTGDATLTADYSGLECRWSEIPSPASETVAVIVESRGDPGGALATYRRVLGWVRRIYGEPEQCRPVAEDGLHVTLAGRTLSNETRLKNWRDGAARRLAAALRLRVNVIAAWLLLALRVRTESADYGRYRRDIVSNTDFRKFDGTIRLVLAGTETQREELVTVLDRLRSEGAISYGMHVAHAALMTCLVERREGAHFHFVDAAGGGYAAAATALKADREPT